MSKFNHSEADTTAVTTIRTLALDTIANVNSGHPGAPLGMAPAAHVLFSRFFNTNPKNSKWYNRDRFVLSNGHGCALLYVMLHLQGFNVTMDDLKSFRQVGTILPGHPEAGLAEGIEVTTGPLGEGISSAVGLAIAQAHMAAKFNRDGFDLIDNYTYVFTGDGCLMEGVACEAVSLAGHFQLGNLIVVYDDNQITIDGGIDVAFSENVEQRFQSYGWQVLHVMEGDDNMAAIHDAIAEARLEKNKPTLIKVRTTIGYGSKVQGTPGVHGTPLKPAEVREYKTKFGFNPDQLFHIPKETADIYDARAKHGAELEKKWNALLDSYGKKYPKEHEELTRRISGKLTDGWEKSLPTFTPKDPAQASRKWSGDVLNALAPSLPELTGGSADLTGSNLTKTKGSEDFQAPATGLGSYKGNYIKYGVREHGMGAIANGLAAYGGFIPYVGTFLNFVSFAAPALRLAALSGHQVIYVGTHDSIGLGEDGPTHQPVEVPIHFRAIPNLMFWRPADGNETSAAYQSAISAQNMPTVLSLSRQNLPNLEGSSAEKALRGGYVLHEEEKEDLTIVSTGSELSIAVEAAGKLKAQGIKTRVVSMPCWYVFDRQDEQYRQSVLRGGAPILSMEAYATAGWERYSHEQFGLKSWGASGPYQKLYEKFGLTGDNIAQVGKKVVDHYKKRGGELRSPIDKALVL